jgi:Flp pilus assembly protein CpaB
MARLLTPPRPSAAAVPHSSRRALRRTPRRSRGRAPGIDDGATPFAGVVAARPGLPNARAVVGGLLVACAALGAWTAARSGSTSPSATYAVARAEVRAGQVLRASDVDLVALDLPAAQARGTFGSRDELVGAVARAPVGAGSLLTEAAIAAPGPGAPAAAYREVSVALPSARALNGRLSPGDGVDVVATFGEVSRVLVQAAPVVDVASTSGGIGRSGEEVVVTLALVDPPAALGVAHGGAAADLTLVLATRATAPLPDSFTLGRTAAAAPTGG